MALSHIFSSPIADFTGTVTVWNSAGVTVTANATEIVRPSNWNSVHNEFLTLSGNTAGASTMSGSNIILQGGNNVTLSANGNTLVFSGGAGGGMSTHNSDYHSGTIFPPNVNQAMGSAYLQMATTTAPGAGAAGQIRIYGEDDNGNARLRYVLPDGTVVQIARDNIFICRNRQGSAITKGQVVYISGGQGATGTAEVQLAKADSATTMPCIGIVLEPSIADNGYGRILVAGKIEDIDTSAFVEGDRVFVSATTAGEMTATAPSYPNLRQRVGVVINSHATQGTLALFTSGAQGEVGIQAISAGTQSATSGQMIFADSNGLAFGMSGSSQITGSYTQSTHSHATAAFSGSNGSFTANTVTFGNLNGLSFYTSNGSIVGSYTAAGGADGGNTLAAGTRTAGSNSVVLFSNANGVTFGLDTVNGSVMTASIAAVGGAQTGISGMANSETTYTSGTVSFSELGAITIRSTTGNQFQFSVNAQSVVPGIQTIAFANTTFTTGGVSFSNANGISFGSSGAQVTASHNALTTARASNDAIGLNTAQTNVTWTVNSAGISLNAAGYAGTTTAITGNASITMNSAGLQFNGSGLAGTTTAITGRASITMNSGGLQFNGNGLAGTGFTSTTTAGTAIVATNSTNGLSLAFPTIITNAITTARASNDAIGTNTAQTNVTWTANSAGLSFNAAGYAGTTTAVTGAAVITLNSLGLRFDGVGLAGTSTGFTGANISGSMTHNSAGLAMSLSVAAPGGGGGSQSIGMSTQTAGGATAGTAGYASGSAILMHFAPGSNITMSQSVNGASATLSIFAPAPGAAVEANPVNLLGANTAGNTTATGSTLGFSGVNLTLSGTNASQIVFSAPATSSLSALANITIGTTGSTIGFSVGAAGGGVTLPGIQPYDDFVQVLGQVGQGSMIIDPQPLPNFVFDRVGLMLQNTNSSNSSGSHTLSFWVGLYTRNDSTLSLHYSMSGSKAITHSGTAGSYSWYSGKRLLPLTVAQTTITENRYWIAVVSRTTSGGANGTYSNYVVSNLNTNFTGIFGQASNATMQPKLGQGIYTATTSGMPNSIAFSQINGTNSLGIRMPVIGFGSGTA